MSAEQEEKLLLEKLDRLFPTLDDKNNMLLTTIGNAMAMMMFIAELPPQAKAKIPTILWYACGNTASLAGVLFSQDSLDDDIKDKLEIVKMPVVDEHTEELILTKAKMVARDLYEKFLR